jgi:hypothetical protein
MRATRTSQLWTILCAHESFVVDEWRQCKVRIDLKAVMPPDGYGISVIGLRLIADVCSAPQLWTPLEALFNGLRVHRSPVMIQL